MKSLAFFLAVAASTLRSADTPLPEFNSSTIGHPPLSLSESSKLPAKSHSFASTLPTLEELTKGGFPVTNARPSIQRLASAQPRFSRKAGLWNMPIFEPNPNIDHKIVIKEPDPRVDFKMLVQPP